MVNKPNGPVMSRAIGASMARYRDVKKLGHSKIAPYVEGESGQARHNRRKKTANDLEDKLRAFAKQNAFEFKVTNNGHHFTLKKGKFIAEWWPSTAKLVINKRWSQGIHCYDYKQMIKMIRSHMPGDEPGRKG
jgi:hypothetical protein